MKKSIQINIGHRLFNIDEDAYQKLDQYLGSLRHHFGPGPETDEIIDDIEDRIADLLSDMKQNSASSVSISDIDSIIATMGEPQEIQAEEENPEVVTEEAAPLKPKKLHRILNGSILGGVCNGIADYFNIDVSIVRLVLVLLVLGSWGSLILLYVILWIILPVGDFSPVNSPRKKLYRDLESSLIGGVLAGIAQYFQYNVRNVRLVFLLPFIITGLSALGGPLGALLSASILWSVIGTEIVVYLILWATVPPAVSATDRMDMKGEPVNVESIKSMVYSSKGDANASSQSLPQRQSSGCARALLFVFIGLMILAALPFLFMASVGTTAVISSGLDLNTIKDFVFSNNSSSIWMNIIIICLILAPILTIAYLLSKRGRTNTKVKNLGLAAIITWAIAILGSISMIGLLGRDFRAQVSKSKNYTIPTSSDTLYVKYIENPDYQIDYSAGMQDYFFEKNNTLYAYAITEFKTSDSEDDNFHLQIQKRTNGKDVFACEKRIENMNFKNSIVGDTLFISRYITIKKPEVYRGQRISMDIALPEGKSIIKPDELGKVDINISRGAVKVYHSSDESDTEDEDEHDDADDDSEDDE